jgi:hypothetical protein
MPYSVGHVKFVMPPIALIGSGLASYRDMTDGRLRYINGPKWNTIFGIERHYLHGKCCDSEQFR